MFFLFVKNLFIMIISCTYMYLKKENIIFIRKNDGIFIKIMLKIDQELDFRSLRFI